MRRTILLFTFVFVLMLLPANNDTGQAASGSPTNTKLPPYAPGQVLVQFEADTPLRTAQRLVAPLGVTSTHRIARKTYTITVPVGHEGEVMEQLLSTPGIQYASLNYRITQSPLALEKPTADAQAHRNAPPFNGVQPSCITDLWVSMTRQGEPLQENILPSDTPLVYVVFEYADCDHEAVRVQIFYLGLDTAPQGVFDEQGLSISGSGVISVEVRAWEHFAKKGVFPIGAYLTIVSLSPEGGWDEAASVPWQVSTFSNDHWLRGSSNYQWSLHSTGRRALAQADINLPQAWDITTGSPEFTIAVVSTGIDIDHPDLNDKIWTNQREIPGNGIDDDGNGCVDDIHGCEFFNGQATADPKDPIGWGTFTCGIAAAETNNELGMAGISWGARCMPIKVLRLLPGNVLGGYLADLISAIDYAVTNGAQIIHIGPRVEEDNVPEDKLALLQAAIDDAVNQGALVIAGTGDLGEDHLQYPAGFDNVIAVGAYGLQNARSWFSNYGPGIDIVAPGELILSTCAGGDYCIGKGTSLAAAHVDGVVSLIWSINPKLSPAEVRTILRESASDLDPTGYDLENGYGQLNAFKAATRTPHNLWLRTPNLNQLALTFLLDDHDQRACQTVWNQGTGPYTWMLNPKSDWLLVSGPDDPIMAPVPSNAEVCVDAQSFSEPGTFETMIEANSRLTLHQGAVDVNVKTIYRSDLSRVRLSLIQRP